MHQAPLIVIVGPTASGKTALAVKLARRFGGYIVSVDSRQLYRGMDIGTAMPSKTDRKRVRHFLVDIIRPNETYTLARHQSDVFRILKNERGLPFLVGGTGLYIDAVTQNWDIPKVAPNQDLRKELERTTLTRLVARLKKLDLKSYKAIDRKNKRRVIRALEVVLATGESFVGQQQQRPFPYRVLKLGVNPPKGILEKNIRKRVHAMFRLGLVAETKRLLRRYSSDLPALSSIGYREIADFLAGRCTKAEAIDRIVTRTRQYAKRQMTWFKRDLAIHRVNTEAQAKALVTRFLKEKPRRRP